VREIIFPLIAVLSLQQGLYSKERPSSANIQYIISVKFNKISIGTKTTKSFISIVQKILSKIKEAKKIKILEVHQG
jgi:hypothetical protein